MFLVDSHCHLDLILAEAKGTTLEEIINRAKSAGVKYILNVCVNLQNFQNVLKIAEAYPFISASVGLHPNEKDQLINVHSLIELAEHKKIVAIGETGLDYYRSQGDLTWQQERFRTHIIAAKKIQKPLIIHTRNAKEDTIRIMQEEKAEAVGGVMHCFSEDWTVAKKALDLNFYISLSGIVTFKNATTMHEVAKNVPLDRLLIETDAPYLAPNPYRGKLNEPAYVLETAKYIAALRKTSTDVIAEQTTANFFNLFKGATQPHV